MGLLTPPRGSAVDGELSAVNQLIGAIVIVSSCVGCAPTNETVFRRTAEIHVDLESFMEDRADSLAVGILQVIPAGGEDEAVVVATVPSEASTLWRYSRRERQAIARRGAGPGELAAVGGLTVSGSGFLAFDVGRQSLLAFDGRGKFSGERKVRRVAPLSAILDRQGNLYWVEVKDGSARFLRMSASGDIESVRSGWPWRSTLRAARLAVVGGDSIAAFSDVTGCVGVVAFPTRTSTIVGCVDDSLKSSVRRAADRFFKRSSTIQGRAGAPNFPLEAIIVVGIRRLLLAVPALGVRDAASYVVDLDSLTLSPLIFQRAGANSVDFRPQSGGWAGSDTYLTDGYNVVKAVFVCKTTSPSECRTRDMATTIRFLP